MDKEEIERKVREHLEEKSDIYEHMGSVDSFEEEKHFTPEDMDVESKAKECIPDYLDVKVNFYEDIGCAVSVIQLYARTNGEKYGREIVIPAENIAVSSGENDYPITRAVSQTLSDFATGDIEYVPEGSYFPRRRIETFK